jgi:hypothetical protein
MFGPGSHELIAANRFSLNVELVADSWMQIPDLSE